MLFTNIRLIIDLIYCLFSHLDILQYYYYYYAIHYSFVVLPLNGTVTLYPFYRSPSFHFHLHFPLVSFRLAAPYAPCHFLPCILQNVASSRHTLIYSLLMAEFYKNIIIIFPCYRFSSPCTSGEDFLHLFVIFFRALVMSLEKICFKIIHWYVFLNNAIGTCVPVLVIQLIQKRSSDSNFRTFLNV